MFGTTRVMMTPAMLGTSRRVQRRVRFGVLVVIAFVVLMVSATWACILPVHPFVITPSSGPAGQAIDVRVAAPEHVLNGTGDILIRRTSTGSCNEDIGNITYTNGVGIGSATIPSDLSPGTYRVCADPDRAVLFNNFTVT